MSFIDLSIERQPRHGRSGWLNRWPAKHADNANLLVAGNAEAAWRFPSCAAIPFNRGCYAALSGRLAEVQGLLEEAIRLEARIEELSFKDPDLKLYWRSQFPDLVR